MRRKKRQRKKGREKERERERKEKERERELVYCQKGTSPFPLSPLHIRKSHRQIDAWLDG